MTDNDSDDEELVAGDDDQLNEEIVEDGRHTLWSIDGIMGDYDVSTEAFDEGILEKLKLKEMELVKRREYGYYRCKSKYAVVYAKIVETISPYLARDRWRELHHNYHTHKNE